MDHDTQYTEKRAGAYLGSTENPISVRTLQNWRTEGKGPRFLKIGRLVRYRRSALDEFIQSSERQSTSEKGNEW